MHPRSFQIMRENRTASIPQLIGHKMQKTTVSYTASMRNSTVQLANSPVLLCQSITMCMRMGHCNPADYLADYRYPWPTLQSLPTNNGAPVFTTLNKICWFQLLLVLVVCQATASQRDHWNASAAPNSSCPDSQHGNQCHYG
jgi:hypothetical protein